MNFIWITVVGVFVLVFVRTIYERVDGTGTCQSTQSTHPQELEQFGGDRGRTFGGAHDGDDPDDLIAEARLLVLRPLLRHE